MANLTLSPPRRPGSERRASGGRARDLLRQHYGLGGIPVPSGNPNDPMDMGEVNDSALLIMALSARCRFSRLRRNSVLRPDACYVYAPYATKTTQFHLRRCDKSGLQPLPIHSP